MLEADRGAGITAYYCDGAEASAYAAYRVIRKAHPDDVHPSPERRDSLKVVSLVPLDAYGEIPQVFMLSEPDGKPAYFRAPAAFGGTDWPDRGHANCGLAGQG